MDDKKTPAEVNGSPAAYEESDLDDHMRERGGTQADAVDMSRLGKKQELRREFQFFSITGYAVMVGASYEFALVNSVASLPNGGSAGTVYMFIVACTGMFFTTLSMAEMASMAPSAGQYHWCSELAPKSFQKFLSFTVGNFSALGWQMSLAATVYAAAQQLMAAVVVAHPNFVIEGYMTATVSWGVLVLAIFLNTVAYRKLPLLEGCVLLLHVFGFFAIVITLWVTAPRGDSSVLTTFDSNGWPSAGVACLVGLNAAVGDIIGADSSVHLSEELKEASYILPRSMVATALTNYVLGFVMLITLVFCLGDLDAALSSPTEQPYVQVILNATRSPGGTIALVSLMFCLICAGSVNNALSASRQLWSFARDGGPPFSGWLSQIRGEVPVNALLASSAISVVLTCIAIGSTVAYTILLSLVVSGLLSSYMICIACILYKRLSGEPMPPSRFNLGKSGNVINIIAICFLLVAWIFQFFPATPDPTLAGMNWSALIFGSFLIFFALYYWVRARHRYVPPVVHIKDL